MMQYTIRGVFFLVLQIEYISSVNLNDSDELVYFVKPNPRFCLNI